MYNQEVVNDIKYIKETLNKLVMLMEEHNRKLDERIIVLEESRKKVEQEIDKLKKHCVA